MKTKLLILFLLTTKFLFSQDTTVTWINNIDTNSFKVCFKKRCIPKEFYSIINVDNSKDIANAKKKYQTGCVGHGLPHHRLNWLAKDKNNHWVLSISYGGLHNRTDYFFIDKEKGKININCFNLRLSRNCNQFDLSFGNTITRIKAKLCLRVDIN